VSFVTFVVKTLSHLIAALPRKVLRDEQIQGARDRLLSESLKSQFSKL